MQGSVFAYCYLLQRSVNAFYDLRLHLYTVQREDETKRTEF